MKPVCTFLALLSLSVAPALAQSTDGIADTNDRGELPVPDLSPHIPDYSLTTRTFVFPSGLTVYVQPDHSQPMVAITTVFDKGSTSDPAGQEGIAHFVEHFWFKSRHLRQLDEDGTVLVEGPRTWDVLSEMGCGLNASTSNDWTNYMTICPKSALKPLLRLASLRMTDPVGGTYPEEVESEREVIRNELRMRMENGGAGALRYVFDRVYGPEHPYHRMTVGTHGSLDNIEHADIEKFTDDYYKPEYATMVLVGDFDVEEAASLIFENFEPSLLHPDLTSDDIVWYPRDGVNPEDIDPDNPRADQVLWTAIAPGTRDDPQPFQLGGEDDIPRRFETFGLPAGAAYNTEVGVFDAPVDERQVIVAWSAPGGYRGETTVARIAANMAGNQVMRGVWDDPRVTRSGGGEGNGKGVPDVGCFAMDDKENTTIMCFMGITESAPGERMAEVLIDQLPEMWNPELMQISQYRSSYENSFSLAKMGLMSSTLLSLDRVAGLYGARATDIAMHAHFTGSPTYHTDTMAEMADFEVTDAMDYARTYMRRDRAAMVVLNPIPEDERTLDSSESDYAGATAENDLVVSAMDPDSITPEFIASQVDLPDFDLMVEETLPNGLRVVVMPHGEAPLVEAQLITRGGSALDMVNMDGWAEGFLADAGNEYNAMGRPVLDPLRIAGSWNDSGTDQYSSLGLRGPSGNVDGALYMLRTRLDNSEIEFRKAKKRIKDARKDLSRRWRRQSYWTSAVWLDQMGTDHAAFHSLTPEDLDARLELDKDAVEAYLAAKYSPANATLLIVGNIDPQDAMAQARTYFGSWSSDSSGMEIPTPEMAPIVEHEPMVYVFDDAQKTQTDIKLYCRMTDASTPTDATRAVAGQMLSDHLFETLRAREGVTYGAYAGSQAEVGGTGMFRMGALVQNDAVALATKVFYQVADDAAAGNFPMERFRPTQLSIARKYVLGQQSVGQMTGRLMGTLGAQDDWSRISGFPERLSSVSMEGMTELMTSCPNTRVVTMVGPEDVIVPQLEEAGIAFEVFDHQAAALELLDVYDIKTAKKYRKAIEEREAAEAAAEAAREDAEGTEDAEETEEAGETEE